MNEEEIINDYELLDLCIQNDSEALSLLNEKYKPFYRITFSNMLAGHETIQMDEWMNECFEALSEAVFRYRQDMGCTFRTYIQNVITNQAYDKGRKAKRKEENPALSSVSMNMAVAEDGTPAETYLWDGGQTLEEQVLNRLEYELIMETLSRKLKDEELKVLGMLCEGYTQVEIEAMTGYQTRRQRRLLERCRKMICIDRAEWD